MKIVEQTANQLKLQASGWKLIIMLTLAYAFPLVISLQILVSSYFYMPWFIYPMVGGWILFSGFNLFKILLYGEFRVSYTFDKSLGLLKMKRQTLRGIKITEWQLKEISQTEIAERIHKDNDGTYTMYSIKLKLKSGEYIPVHLPGVTNGQKNQEMAECIRQFLNLKV
ncbi:MAG: hypothetical protein LDL41_10325 [Coleofasciculus sp. S288]|nr:hypothetical protein [Coleofasciculus sp. S288]